jgi:putative ABC transport system substrate-binding protein
MVTSRILFTAKQKDELWERWKNGRQFITLLGGAATWPLTAHAQQAGRIRRIGVLSGFSASDQDYRQRIDALKQALRDLGWADTNISFEPRFAEGKLDRLPALAAELVNLRVDIIVTSGTEVAQAAHKATSTIPIVMAAIGDAVGARSCVEAWPVRPGPSWHHQPFP